MTTADELLLRQTALTNLTRAERTYSKSAKRTEELREARNHWVRNALRRGATHQQVADATGLTRGRIGQIAQTDEG